MFYTNIRMVALGIDDTYIIIWEDGTIRWDLKHYYDALNDVLINFNKGEEFVALNPSKAGDYFVYSDSQKLALFQVSAAFGKEIQGVLQSEGIQSRAIVRNKEQVGTPVAPTIAPRERTGDFLGGIARSIGIGANLLSVGANISRCVCIEIVPICVIIL